MNDLAAFSELAAEEKDSSVLQEVEATARDIEKRVNDLELKKMLGGEDDARPAIISIHPGAGGTESQDWAQMLLRMYLYWLNKKGFKYEMLDEQPGEEAGIKSATIEVTGDHPYGYLKSENGVHRLVRISPYDANARRHTSFAAVNVYPEIEDIEFLRSLQSRDFQATEVKRDR